MIFSLVWYARQILIMENVDLPRVNFVYAFLEEEAFAAFTVGTFLLIAGFLALHRLHLFEELLMTFLTTPVTATRRTCRQILVEYTLWYAKYLIANLASVTPVSFAVLMFFFFSNAVSGGGHGPFWGIFCTLFCHI
ncbi:transmembrane protein NRF-6 [Trypanosoma rangeli]|uniref:Transmembrane protein NRF-6 n=1 Tax=Trypanosoma rangeli TaxID=5698 RepID=A0A422NG61_TRYRA|nr:transmembrane protein NRF-6 [Trypanosoma rangeli]RNF04448.1 transmembrane protein NRF-6 [Trypanosoma rangeli]|eukprot:RNF04448.1 transmembrane protein NRF-6 [Trypanosoma rangeli]